eukprot:121323-Prorocentrum_minimum.AAC.4
MRPPVPITARVHSTCQRGGTEAYLEAELSARRVHIGEVHLRRGHVRRGAPDVGGGAHDPDPQLPEAVVAEAVEGAVCLRHHARVTGTGSNPRHRPPQVEVGGGHLPGRVPHHVAGPAGEAAVDVDRPVGVEPFHWASLSLASIPPAPHGLRVFHKRAGVGDSRRHRDGLAADVYDGGGHGAHGAADVARVPGPELAKHVIAPAPNVPGVQQHACVRLPRRRLHR